MPKLTITPQSVLLTSGQAITFEVSDGTATAPVVNWTLNPQVGKWVWPDPTALGAPAGPAQYSSATYAAPAILSGPQTIAIVVHTATDSTTATVSLTPDTMRIVPATIDIEEGETQQFEAIVAPTKVLGKGSIEREKITWILSPDSGTPDENGSNKTPAEISKATLDQNGLYRAPKKIANSTTVHVIAASPALGKHAVATVNLVSPPWRGPGAYLLGFYLLLIFSLVIFMVGLWPPALPSPDIAELNRVKAETNLQAKSDLLDKANKENIDAKSKLDANLKAAKAAAGATPGKPAGTAPTPDASVAAQAEAANKNLNRAEDAWDDAKRELDNRRSEERAVRQPTVQTKIAKSISREIDLLLLVLLGGSLGSFLHIAPSFSDFMGNRTLKSTWAWWYALRPFIGAVLALVFYSATRAGLIANPATLNPFGVVAIAALVGLFSKSATLKLGEVFDTLFKTDKAKEQKDKLAPQSQTLAQQSGPSATAK
jgi:hypothetical protein